jgi:chromate transporter
MMSVSKSDAFKVWLRVAALSFGGPANQIAVMHRILVDEKKWISEERFLHALNYCMLLPGPEAQQLATYIGWLMHRTAGGLVAGLLFILPGFLAILALSILYVTFGQQPWVAAVFYGLKAAVVAIVIEAVIRIGRRALKTPVLISIAGAAFVALFFFSVPFPLVILTAAVIGLVMPATPETYRPPSHASAAIDIAIEQGALAHIVPNTPRTVRKALVWLALWWAPVVACMAAFGPDHIFSTLGTFFAQVAAVTFGGAYAVLSYVAQDAVQHYNWLSASEMMDGLAMAETTPGPLIMVLQFVGYLAAARTDLGVPPVLAGIVGSLITVWVLFTPSFLWIFTGAPYVEALLGQRRLQAALSAITAAVVGVILNLSVWFAVHVLFREVRVDTWGPARLTVPAWATFDGVAVVLVLGSMAALLKFKVGLGPTLTSAAILGFAWKMLAG